MKTVVIRDYQNPDWNQVLKMMTQTMEYHNSIQDPKRFNTYTPNLLRNYLRGLVTKHRLKKGKLLISVNDTNCLTGFIYGETDTQDAELRKSAIPSGTIKELFVSSEMRKSGVAQKLMAKMEDYLIKNGCTLIRLKDVHSNNIPAQNLYAKLKYIPRVVEYAKRVDQ